MKDDVDSTFVKHIPCPDCGSDDNGALYSSGWAHCLTPGCDKNWRPEGDYDRSSGPVQRKKDVDGIPFIDGDYTALTARSLSEETCKMFRYRVGKVPKDHPMARLRGKVVQIEEYFEGNELVAQKLRTKDKEFSIIGDNSKVLFGRHCVKPGGKLLVVTEGAIDAMSYAEARENWPAVSIPNGAQSAKKAVKANLEFLESFEKVVFCFDNDEAGREGIESIKGILSPGRMHIASLPEEYKDYNEAWLAGDIKAILHSVYQAEEVRPDGLVDIEDILEEALKPVEWGLPWFIPELNKATFGRRFGEVYGFGGGTGTGKTDIFTEQVAYDIGVLKERVGLLFLEQKPPETAKRVAGKFANRRFHVPDDGWTEEELITAITRLKGMVTFYDSFGQTDWKEIKTRIRHMHIAKGIRIFYLDHLTAMADTADERGSLEQIMKEMAGLADELSIIIHFISHLTTPDGTPHEEGGRVMIRHFKGSRAIGFWSFFMFGLERDQQADDPRDRHRTTFRVLKDRYTGQATGLTLQLGYDAETGRIILPADLAQMPDTEEDEPF